MGFKGNDKVDNASASMGEGGGEARERMVVALGHRVHVVENGRGRGGPALLLIHGHAGSVAWWDQVVPPLAVHHRVIRVDLLGHGSSDKPAAGYTMEEQGRLVSAVLEEMEVDQVIAVGHATGAVVSVALAEHRRAAVAGLVLFDTGPNVGAFLKPGGLSQLVEVRGVGRVLWALRSTATIRKGLDSAFTRKIPVPEQIVNDVRGIRYRTIVATPKETKAFMVRRTLPDRLLELDLPALVVFGAEDRRWRSSSSAGFRVVPDLEVEVLPGVGHSPMLEDPDGTVKVLTHFLERFGSAHP